MSFYPIGDPAELKDQERAVIGVSRKRGPIKDFKNNILNSYRSLTYSFTIAALDANSINNHTYKSGPLKNIVLKSGGKGDSKLTGIDSATTPTATEISLASNLSDTGNMDVNDLKNRKIAQDTVKNKWESSKIIEGFNQYSAGRFDMFIDNVEINGLMNFNNITGTTLGTTLQFTVTEPHSISGFIEALQAASLAAGYLNYVNAVFLLKIEFWGYSDKVDIAESSPELIKDAVRYIPFIFTEVGVEISNEGAKYNCKGLFYGDRSLGKSNEIKQNISMSGKKVKDILENLFKNINDQIVETDKKSKTDSFHDEYEIKFPQRLANGKFDFNKTNKIANSDVFYLNRARANILYDMPDPGDETIPQNKQNPSPQEYTQNPESYKYSPESKVKVQFLAGKNITECIEAVIVDSNYIRGIIDDIKNEKTDGGLVDYFLIQVHTEYKPQINPITKTNYKKYTYVISEYKTHFSTLPPFQTENWSSADLKSYVLKQYDWYYTGKNIDVLSFKIKFDNLFYSAIPFGLGNNDYDIRKNSAGGVERKTKEQIKEQTPSPNQALEPTPRQYDTSPIQPTHQGAATPVDFSDPYFLMVRKIHEAVINSNVNGVEGDLEILGDPFFISTSNNNSRDTELAEGYENVTADGAVDQTTGQILIEINFRNPIDIDTFENGGTMKFDKNKAAFSGIYRITEIKNIFRDGLFKQEFKVFRLLGQVDKSNADTKVVSASDVIISTVA